jgi:hypothetical protein
MSSKASDIQTNAHKPKSVDTDGLTVNQHSIPDQIAADKYECSNTQAKQKNRGISFAQFRHQGSVR